VIHQLRQTFSPDVCHVLDHSHANLLAACEPSQSVITVHDVIPMLSLIGELNFSTDRAMKYTFPRKLQRIAQCARIITISECTKRQLLRFVDFPAERVDVVYYGVSEAFSPVGAEDEREEVFTRHGIDPSRRVVLHVCTRNRYKNTPALLRALAKLPNDVVLLRVGADLFDDERALRDNLGVADRVVDAGRVMGDDKLAAYYRSADVFAFPSTFEGFGWPPLEAMACGTPVVAGDAASIPEVVGDAGRLVDPHDDEGLARVIDRILSNEQEAQALRLVALDRAANFTWLACAEKTLEVYRRVIENQPIKEAA